MMHRLLTLGPDSEPVWAWLYVHPVGTHWAAMIVGDDVAPPEAGTLTGLTFPARSIALSKTVISPNNASKSLNSIAIYYHK